MSEDRRKLEQKQEDTLNSEPIYQGKIIKVRVDTVQLPSGSLAEREIVEHPGAVALVPVLDDGSVVLVRQYRHAVKEDLLEIPAGTLNPDEDPLECAKRELLEETSYTSDRVVPLMLSYMAPGYADERMHYFLARGLKRGAGTPEEDESIDVEIVPLDQVLSMIRAHKIQDAKSIAGLLMALTVLAEE